MLPTDLTSGKSAICISGEIRTAVEAYPSFSRFFGPGHDVFIHCWQDEESIIDRVKKLYNPVAFVCEPPGRGMQDLPFSSMLYSMMMANDLKRKHEMSMGRRYDTVIKTRFDIVFEPSTSLPRRPSDPRTINVVGLSNGFNNVDYDNKGIDDVMFWGDSTAMDVACDTYRHFISRCRPTLELLRNGQDADPHDCFLSPGVLIYQCSIRRNVHFRFIEGFDLVIFRKHAAHLHPIRDFARIREECKWWKP